MALVYEEEQGRSVMIALCFFTYLFFEGSSCAEKINLKTLSAFS